MIPIYYQFIGACILLSLVLGFWLLRTWKEGKKVFKSKQRFKYIKGGLNQEEINELLKKELK
jgi:hypothetical protein